MFCVTVLRGEHFSKTHVLQGCDTYVASVSRTHQGSHLAASLFLRKHAMRRWARRGRGRFGG
eukprot:363093-Chlamydomonas_euryale.AAC.5